MCKLHPVKFDCILLFSMLKVYVQKSKGKIPACDVLADCPCVTIVVFRSNVLTTLLQ